MRSAGQIFTKTFFLEKHSLGINTLFATMSDPPTPNLQFLELPYCEQNMCGPLAIFSQKTLTFWKKKYSLGIDTLFATMSDPPTPNLEFVVHSSLQV